MERRRTRHAFSPECGVEGECGGYDAPMRYAGAWRRRGVWAIAVPWVLPAAMILALVSGGLRLGAAGQLLTGPEVPRAASATAPARAARPDRLPTVPPAPAQALFGPAAVAAPAPAAGAPPITRPVGTTPGSPVRGGALATAASPSASPPPAPQPSNPIRALGRGVAEPAGGLPAPAGPAGHDAITTVVELIPPPALDKTLNKLHP